MRRARVLWGAYVGCFEDALDRYKRERLMAEEAGEPLGLSSRNFRRPCVRYEAKSVDGLRDQRLGRVSHRRVPETELERMRRLSARTMPTSLSSFAEIVTKEQTDIRARARASLY